MKKYITIGVVLVLLAALLGYLVGSATQWQETKQDTVRVVKHDTIPYYQPVPKDSAVVRYITKVLYTAGKPQNTENQNGDSIAMLPVDSDSAAVVIPITQKKYETEDYRAYVSGYEPSLDSIFVYRKQIETTITQTKVKRPRVGFGLVVGGGYGLLNKRPDVFVGGAMYIRIWP